MGLLSRRVESEGVANLPLLPRMTERMDRPGWRHLLTLAPRLARLLKGLSQHPGGMLASSTPLTDLMPVQPSAIAGRYVAQWDRDSADDAGVVKIDPLALVDLSQMQQAVRPVRNRSSVEPDLGRIDYRDPGVFDDLGWAETVSVFQVESAAHVQTITRMQPRDIHDLAMEVAAVRLGVGANNGVAEFLRWRSGAAWDYDHPLERDALERSLGVIMFQDQVVRLGMDVGGLSAADADGMRRAFGRGDAATATAGWRARFLAGAAEQGVSSEAAERIFGKFNPHYMFPEGHALAFAFTAYQMAWLRRYHPLEFYVALFNEQPMGFWDLDTLKQNARQLACGWRTPASTGRICAARPKAAIPCGWGRCCCGRGRPAGSSAASATCWAVPGCPGMRWSVWPGPGRWTDCWVRTAGGRRCGRLGWVIAPASAGGNWHCC